MEKSEIINYIVRSILEVPKEDGSQSYPTVILKHGDRILEVNFQDISIAPENQSVNYLFVSGEDVFSGTLSVDDILRIEEEEEPTDQELRDFNAKHKADKQNAKSFEEQLGRLIERMLPPLGLRPEEWEVVMSSSRQ